MAYVNPCWIPRGLTASGAIAQGVALLPDGAGQLKTGDNANDGFYGVATKAIADDAEIEGHLLYGSDVIECLAAGAIVAGAWVRVNATGEFVTLGTAAGTYFVAGFVKDAVADNDIFELHVCPHTRVLT